MKTKSSSFLVKLTSDHTYMANLNNTEEPSSLRRRLSPTTSNYSLPKDRVFGSIRGRGGIKNHPVINRDLVAFGIWMIYVRGAMGV
jgi:hypothetical protein